MPRGKQIISVDLPRPVELDLRGARKTGIIHDTLRQAIRNGLLPPGTPLPASRTLAGRWRVSRGIVEVAFDLLSQEGYIVRKPGSGSLVSALLPDEQLRASGVPDGCTAPPACAGSSTDPPPLPARHLPFLARMPDPGLLDRKAWSGCLASAALNLGNRDLGGPHPAGLAALRSSLAQHLRLHRGIACNAQDILIVRDVRDVIDLAARTVLRPGDMAVLEDPGYRWPRRILQEAGAHLAYVRTDHDGLVADELPAQPSARLLHVTRAHQAPLGHVLSAPRRQLVLAWAERHHRFIIEDDQDGEFGHEAAPPPALKADDHHERVIHCGSFDRSLFPELRVAYCIVPAALRTAFRNELGRRRCQASLIEQAALAAFLEGGHFARHLRVCRTAYRRRRDLLLQQISQAAGFHPGITGGQSGVHLVLWLPSGTDEAAFCQAARLHDIRLQGISAWCGRHPQPPGVLIGYAALTDRQVRHAGHTLGTLLARHADGPLAG